VVLNTVFVLLAINLGIFIATQISPEAVGNLGLYSDTELFFRRPWGIITSMFVHDGIFHLFANMITLYFFGSFLLRLVGNRMFLLIYFGGGIVGGILFILLASNAIAVGASGAVFALGGAMALMAPRLRVIIFPIPAPIPLWVAVLGIFILLTVLPSLNTFSNIAWQAHLGGAAFGLVAGYLLKRRGRYYV
jgi:membrane associated rhomboid family serine protease